MKTFYLVTFLFFSVIAFGQMTSDYAENDLEINESNFSKTKIPTPSITSIYPNPVSNYVTIGINNTIVPVEIVLLDAYNREIQKFKTRNNELKIEGLDIQSGVYRIILKTEKGIYIQKQKLVVQ